MERMYPVPSVTRPSQHYGQLHPNIPVNPLASTSGHTRHTRKSSSPYRYTQRGQRRFIMDYVLVPCCAWRRPPRETTATSSQMQSTTAPPEHRPKTDTHWSRASADGEKEDAETDADAEGETGDYEEIPYLVHHVCHSI
ncbi:hypothetical protein MVEN_00021500 [Mycena venus]|uniref:Uncharacterized protein n=1 Tax=Mycena venus TaxID=2733690 RepID=A0A8H6Z6B3_9AGAR|nr:hypothetical protein MVEN_00021500 [Mycena venus]